MVFKRGNKIYARAYVNGVDIKVPVGPNTPENRRKAKAVEREIKNRAEAARNNHEPWTVVDEWKKSKQKIPFSQLTQEYLQGLDTKPATVREYESIIRLHLMPEFGHLDVRDITEARVERWKVNLSIKLRKSGKALSPRRINKILERLGTMMDLALRRKYIKEDPTKNIKRRQEPATDIDPLSEEELTLALSCIEPHFKPMFTTLAYTGARPNEVKALRWTDIDWQRGEIRINKGRVRGVEGLPKTKSSQRILPILEPVKEALELLKDRKIQQADGYIFLSKKGLPINQHLDRVWEKALKKAGLRHRPSYQLRHTFASQCLLKGLSPGYVAGLLGHQGLEILYRHYARWINDASKYQEKMLRESFSSAAQPTPKIKMLS